MILHEAQKSVVQDDSRFRVICAGRRFGKTILAVEELIFTAMHSDGARVAYLAPTYQSARDIAWDALKNRLKEIKCEINESRLEVSVPNVFKGKSKIFFRSWDNVETLRGQYFDFLILDEVAQYRNFWSGWQEVLSPCLTDRKGKALFISTPLGFNSFYDLYNLQDKDLDFKSFHFTSYDNPHIPKEEIDRQKLSLTEDAFAQEFMADFRKTTGLVYKEFDRIKHIFNSKPIYNSTNRFVGVDFGFTNPSAMLLVEQDTDNNFWILDEYYKTGKTTAELIEFAKSYKAREYYPDPAEPDRIEEMRRAGLNIRDVSKDIEAGINAVRELFKQNRIKISSSCINLISELETYRYPEKRPDNNEPEIPIKEHDHLLDCCRYALYMKSQTNINREAKVFYPSQKRSTTFYPKG